ncbi:MAG: 16S rRNA (cytosine(1402)-N(4))-methyltransferase RsmH [Bdellovibrionota bacterium]
MGSVHQSVLLEESLEFLQVRPGGVCLDGTLGGGGHTRALAERAGKEGRVIALDLDRAALARAKENLSDLGERVSFVHSSFADGASVLDERGIKSVDGIFLDLGFSSDQMEDPKRGFSFTSEFSPDMRLDPSRGRSAGEIVNEASERELEKIFREYGEEPKAKALAKRIVGARPIRSCKDLAALAEGLYPGRSRVHPATRMFQALRIAANDELGALEKALETLPSRLTPGGRMAVISFHSLEDRIVKHRFAELSEVEKDPITGRAKSEPPFRVVTRRPVVPSGREIEQNPRARSAKLRVLERVAFERSAA